VSKLSERRREIHGMDQTSAQEELKTLRRQLFDLRIQKERGEVKDTRQFAKTKADIARLIHHLSELRHAEVVEAEGGLESVVETTEAATGAVTSAPPRRRANATATAKAGATEAPSPATPPPATESPTTAPLATSELPATSTGSEEEDV
jgi:ribosomal protein L29